MTSLTRKDWILLILLTIAWGLSWPIMKIGVRNFPPLTFRTLGMLGGLPVIWLAARLQGASLKIPEGHMKTLVKLAVPNMLIWHLLIIFGVKMLASGRAAILGYTMPVWAVLSGLIFFRQRVTNLAWLGIGCAMAGALLLLSSEFSTLSGQPLGSLLVLIAAAAWGYGTVLVRHTKIEMPTISITFWMLALTTTVMTIAAIVFESADWRIPNSAEWFAIVYNAFIVFGFAHVAWYALARKLPPVASGLSVMMIPVLGVFSAAWMLHETPHWQDYGAMLLILAAMSTVLLKPGTVAHK